MTSKAPVYVGHEYLHPVKEISRGRFGAGVLLVYDAQKCDHVVCKRVSLRDSEEFERQVLLHIRASFHQSVVRFMGLLPSSTTCFQYAVEYLMDGNLRKLVVSDVGLPDAACKRIIQQLSSCLTYLHNSLGIVHGNVNPENVLITSISRCNVKLSNFGKAHTVGSSIKISNKKSCDDRYPDFSWKINFRRFKSYLSQRTSSLKISPRGRRRQSIGTAVECDQQPGEEVRKRKVPSLIRRYSSVLTSESPILKSGKEPDIHEFTLDDFKNEVSSIMFSQAFTAPELVNATRYVASPAADNWSLAILAIYCVTGNTPWEVASVENIKYTTFLHSGRRSQSLTPTLREKRKHELHSRLAPFRSASLSSLMVSMKKKPLSERKMSAIFEKCICDFLKQPANSRNSICSRKDVMSKKWGEDAHKWSHYEDCFFDEDWIKEQ
ncbi:unnamed protein product [Clavelina lepadiformis]|uniref:Protein kinase domain-containing protein n=1 Tax=Clavelina lepadiformis TaxID=159417 RepID=A0ABP0GZQ1_CLALP